MGSILTKFQFSYFGNNIDLDVCMMEGKSYKRDGSKRDFTFNAIYYDILDGKIIDPF